MQFTFARPLPLPSSRELFYRYDPPTLLVNLHLPKQQGGNCIKKCLEMMYQGSGDTVRLFNFNFNQGVDILHLFSLTVRLSPRLYIPMDERQEVAEFLTKHHSRRSSSWTPTYLRMGHS